MKEGYIYITHRKVKTDIRPQLDLRKVEGEISYFKYETYDFFYKGTGANLLKELEKMRDELKILQPELEKMLSQVKCCQSSFNAPITSTNFEQLVDNAEVFDSNSSFVEDASKIIRAIDDEKEELQTLYTMVSGRLQLCTGTLNEVLVCIQMINNAQATLQNIYKEQIQKYDSYVEEFYENQEAGPIARNILAIFPHFRSGGGEDSEKPSPMSFEEWWDNNIPTV